MKPSPTTISEFRRKVYRYYRYHGKTLPWRKTHDPYRILVSEIMLQQTQIARVIPKYREFLRRFPTIRALAYAPLSAVLSVWQGLGYNRRARYIHEAAKILYAEHGSKVPRSLESLEALPGVGLYTARAILVFAFEKPFPLVETNIRTAILREFCPRAMRVPDRKVWNIVEQTLDARNPREWFYALMDFGSNIKSHTAGINHRSTSYRKQSPFRGSFRETRGAIVRLLAIRGPLSLASLRSKLSSHARLNEAIERLLDEGLIVKKRHSLFLSS